MKEILERNREAVREAGRRLVEIGAELAAGKIDEALARLETARQTYREWEELDRATADIEGVIRDREGGKAASEWCSPHRAAQWRMVTGTQPTNLRPCRKSCPCGSHLAVQHVLGELVGTVLGAALRSGLP